MSKLFDLPANLFLFSFGEGHSEFSSCSKGEGVRLKTQGE